MKEEAHGTVAMPSLASRLEMEVESYDLPSVTGDVFVSEFKYKISRKQLQFWIALLLSEDRCQKARQHKPGSHQHCEHSSDRIVADVSCGRGGVASLRK